MIIVRQDSKLDRSKLSSLLDKYGNTEFTLNARSIQDDINKLEKLKEASKSSIRTENLKRTIKYLNNVLKKAQKNPVQLMWTLKGNEITSMPIEMRQIKMFGVQSTDYIVLENESVLAIDYQRLIDTLAFEIAYRDFGYSTEDIENKLSDVSIVGVYDSSILDAVVEEDAYEHTLGMMIDDTPYMSADKTRMFDYFGNSIETDKYYRSIIENTRAIAMSIVMQDILSKVGKSNLKVKIAGVFESSVYLILPNGDNETAARLLTDSVVVRTFGRRFEISPKVQMY